jgi:hypothetical protein
MSKHTSSEYRRSPEAVLDTCDTIGIVKGFLKTDTFAEFTAKLLASTTMSAADITFAEDDENNRDTVTIAAKALTRTGTCLDTDDSSVAHWDSVGEVVHLVLDNTDIEITASNPTINKPASTHYLNTVA